MSATADPLINGVLPITSQSVNEALEYQKILKLRDEVFAGSHPRLTVPAHALRLASTLTPQVSSQTQLSVPQSVPTTTSPNQSVGREDASTVAQAQNNVPNVSNSQPVPSSLSEFNPVLLTKSDDLLKAESQLKRQRLEKALRDQFEQKRLDARKRPAPAEAKPDFDVSAVLARVLNVAKPSSSQDDGSASDSFDENSFYSSRAPDSTPERGAASPTSPQQRAVPVNVDNLDSAQRVQSAVMGSPLNLEPDETSILNSIASASQRRPAVPGPSPRNVELTAMDVDDDEEEEEGEYSPPEATVQYPLSNEISSQNLPDSRDPRSRPLRRYSELDDNDRPGSPSDGTMRSNVRSRKDRNRQQFRTGSPDQSQDHPKKRRKLDKRAEKRGRRNGGLSPDAFIKEENISPPPFHDVQPLGSGRLRPLSTADRPIIIDDGPVQDVRYLPASSRYAESPNRPSSRQLEPSMPASESRVLTRAKMRPLREDQDLRRVASMHSLRVEQPREYIESYDSPTRVRSGSYARLGSPAALEHSRYELPAEYGRPQEPGLARPSGPVYREVFSESGGVRYEPQSMAPPPPVERIVVDQYGRRFREIIQPERPSVVSRAASVHREIESEYDPGRAIRSSSVFMPPPPSVRYRPVAEPARSSLAPSTRDQYEPSNMHRSASVQVVEGQGRQPIYIDDRGEYQEPVRFTSVRPTLQRYEDGGPVEYISGGHSVHPAGGREGSVFVEERLQPRREYVPIESPRYQVAGPEERIYSSQGREYVAVDPTRDGRQRTVQRYQ